MPVAVRPLDGYSTHRASSLAHRGQRVHSSAAAASDVGSWATFHTPSREIYARGPAPLAEILGLIPLELETLTGVARTAKTQSPFRVLESVHV